MTSFNGDLQSYTSSLLPCVNQVTPAIVQPLESSLTSVGNTVQSLLDAFGVGGVLNGLIVTVIP